MSRAWENLYRALEPLHLYALRQNSLVDRELAAYDAAFAPLEELLEELGRQAFVQSARDHALAQHEKLVGLAPRDTMDIDGRRALVLYRQGVAPSDFHRQGMAGSIRAAGMFADLVEDPAGESLTVRCLDVLDQAVELDALKERVRTVLPAHLDAEFDIGAMTWEMFDGFGVRWSNWDAADLTWTQFDLCAEEIFQPKED